jgi:AraC-like DNA-binding protein
MLGFAEQSSFQRAFRRWFNMTPGEYRRAQIRQSV